MRFARFAWARAGPRCRRSIDLCGQVASQVVEALTRERTRRDDIALPWRRTPIFGGALLIDARVAAVIHFMNGSVGEALTMQGLSKRVNLSPTRLRQLFKKETGRSPMKYLRELRMRHAERLLRSTFLSVKEIAFVIGVRHASSFVHAFKRVHGLTPTEFRAQSEPTLNEH